MYRFSFSVYESWNHGGFKIESKANSKYRINKASEKNPKKESFYSLLYAAFGGFNITKATTMPIAANTATYGKTLT
jgi:hypothetical protein